VLIAETPRTGRLRLAVPALVPVPDARAAAGSIARLVASGAATSKAELTRATGLPRSTVSACVDALLAERVIEVAGTRRVAGRGRPADVLAPTRRSGVVLLVDLGVDRARLAVVDLGQAVLAARTLPVRISDGPEAVLSRVAEALGHLLAEADGRGVRAVVVGLPAPVDPVGGAPVRPPIMPGWDGHPVSEVFAARFGAPVLVENDVNLCALGESRALPPDQSPLLYVVVDAGIGGGIITRDGDVHRGADGAAGDIGHLRVPSAARVPCVCGNIGCIEAVASAAAMVRELGEDGPGSIAGLAAALAAGEPRATQVVRAAAPLLGEMVATLVHCINPVRVVLGGPLTEATDALLAGVRSVVYQVALPLATRNLVLTHSVLGERAALAGAAVLGIEHALSAALVGV
jgi:predicted NBD/HSP70 family sugar kinase